MKGEDGREKEQTEEREGRREKGRGEKRSEMRVRRVREGVRNKRWT